MEENLVIEAPMGGVPRRESVALDVRPDQQPGQPRAASPRDGERHSPTEAWTVLNRQERRLTKTGHGELQEVSQVMQLYTHVSPAHPVQFPEGPPPAPPLRLSPARQAPDLTQDAPDLGVGASLPLQPMYGWQKGVGMVQVSPPHIPQPGHWRPPARDFDDDYDDDETPEPSPGRPPANGAFVFANPLLPSGTHEVSPNPVLPSGVAPATQRPYLLDTGLVPTHVLTHPITAHTLQSTGAQGGPGQPSDYGLTFSTSPNDLHRLPTPDTEPDTED